MNHTKHMYWMIGSMIVILILAAVTNTNFLLLLSPLFCLVMMLGMLIGMGAHHDKK